MNNQQKEQNMTIYTEVCILPHHAGFGQFQRGELQVGPETSFAELSQLESIGNLTPLREALYDPDFIAAGIKDIRGFIHNQPQHLYALNSKPMATRMARKS